METLNISFPIRYIEPYTEEGAIRYMKSALDKLVKFGALKGNLSDIILDYKIHYPGGYAVASVKKDAIVDMSKFQSVGAGLSYPIDESITVDSPTQSVKIDTTQKTFSATTIQERLRIAKLDPKIKFRLTIKDYNKYYTSNKAKLEKDPVGLSKLKTLFLSDTMTIFNEVLPLIQEGKQLGILTGLNTITKDMNEVARELSLAYKRALKQSKTGMLSKNILVPLQQKYSEFMNKLIPQVFPDYEKLIQSNRSYSMTSDGRIKLFE